MLKLLVIFGTLLAFIYVLSGLENQEIFHSNRNEKISNELDTTIIYPVNKQLEAYNNKNLSEFIKYFANDVKLYRLKTGELFCNGRDNLIAIYGDLFTHSPNLKCKVVKRITCGDFVIDEEIVTGIRNNSNDLHATAIYEIKDSIIVKAWFINAK